MGRLDAAGYLMSYTQRAGNSVGVVGAQLWTALSGGRMGASVHIGCPPCPPAAVVRYKNDGYYVAGSVWESWVTNDNPSSTPPSGHTLTQLQHVQIS